MMKKGSQILTMTLGGGANYRQLCGKKDLGRHRQQRKHTLLGSVRSNETRERQVANNKLSVGGVLMRMSIPHGVHYITVHHWRSLATGNGDVCFLCY
jgi:hypothetical protein